MYHLINKVIRSANVYIFLIAIASFSCIMKWHGDDRLRRGRLVPDCEPRGTDLVNSVQTLSANRTSYSAMPLAA